MKAQSKKMGRRTASHRQPPRQENRSDRRGWTSSPRPPPIQEIKITRPMRTLDWRGSLPALDVSFPPGCASSSPPPSYRRAFAEASLSISRSLTLSPLLLVSALVQLSWLSCASALAPRVLQASAYNCHTARGSWRVLHVDSADLLNGIQVPSLWLIPCDAVLFGRQNTTFAFKKKKGKLPLSNGQNYPRVYRICSTKIFWILISSRR